MHPTYFLKHKVAKNDAENSSLVVRITLITLIIVIGTSFYVQL